MRRCLMPLIAVMLLPVAPYARSADEGAPPYWSTFSIIAVDPATGMAGVAIASSTWTEHASDILTPGISPGTGIIISQAALLQRNYARGVQLLKEGKSPSEVIDALKAEDPGFETRQIAVVDKSGRSAAFSGSETLAWSGSQGGEYFSAQGNILVNAGTVPAMVDAFVAAAGQPLPDRLMAALVAGNRAGGDARGKQFATLQVMRADNDGTPVNEVVFDVADSADPVAELDRLFRIHNVSLDLRRIGELQRADKIAEAIQLAQEALARLPEGHRRQPFEQLNTSLAVLYYRTGDKQKAREFLKPGASVLPIHRRLFEQRARNDETVKQMLADAELLRYVYGQ
jgi:uncharacterized Ntn-hydrolase superfamily protein